MDLLLASTSPIRSAMLANAGVKFAAIPSGVDEDAIKQGSRGGDDKLAADLAAAKALSVSGAHRQALVIGSDSLVSVDGRRFSKPAGRDEAEEHLRAFSGKAMTLTSAVALARDGELIWNAVANASLHVRKLSEAFIRDYLELEWPEVAYCVGVFRLEGRGIQLFERLEGDYFTVLGMPLLPLLGALRKTGFLAA